MKILSPAQVRAADNYTIEHEPISSIDLMERASEAFVLAFLKNYPELKSTYIFCGTGNNGGDGLAIARLLTARGWDVQVFVMGNPKNASEDFKINFDRLSKTPVLLSEKEDFPLKLNGFIIDAIFGSGLS